MAAMNSVCIHSFWAVLTLSLTFHLQPSLGDKAIRLAHSISDGPLPKADRMRLVRCTKDISDTGLTGLNLKDVDRDLTVVSIQLGTGECFTKSTLASCFINEGESYVILEAVIKDLDVGHGRVFKCEAHYEAKQESVHRLVTLPAVSSTTTATFSTTTTSTTYGLTIPTKTTICSTVFSRTVGTTTRFQQTTSSQFAATIRRVIAPSTASENHSHMTESARSSIDVLSLAVGSCVTLVFTILVLVATRMWRRQRRNPYPDFANASHRLRLPFDIHDFYFNHFPLAFRRRLSSNFNHSDRGDAESIYMRPQSNRLPTAGPSDAHARRQKSPAASNRGRRRNFWSTLYLTPTNDISQQRAQRPLPNPHREESEATSAKRIVSHSNTSTQQSAATVPLDPPAPHTFGQNEAVHVSSPYEDVS